MERKNHDNRLLTVEEAVNLAGSLVQRALLGGLVGYQYGTDRNLYEALGYPTTINDTEYIYRYARQDIAKAIIDRPVKATWRGDLHLMESGDDKDTQLEIAWDELNESFKLKSVFSRLDRLVGLGCYGVLLLGLSDVQNRGRYAEPVKGTDLKLMYVRPVGEVNCKVETWEKRTNNERYGRPLYYSIQLSEPGGGVSSTLRVHWSRIIHVIDDQLESETEGIPRLQVVWNRLMDLEKLVGGSAEMFWRGARPGYHGDIKEGYQRSADWDTNMETQLDEYEHKLRRFITTEGVDIKALAAQVSDPSKHVDVAIQMISAVTGIPKRILTGSERGELSSSQDKDEYMAYVQGRREEFAEPNIIRPFVNKMIEIGVLPKPTTKKYDIQWSDLFAKGEKELADIGKLRAEALKAYGTSMMQDQMPFEAFMEFMMGFSKEQIELIMEMVDAQAAEEPPVNIEEGQIIEQTQNKTEQNVK